MQSDLKATMVSTGNNGRVYADRNYDRFVGWRGGLPGFENLYSKATIALISKKITSLLAGVDPDGNKWEPVKAKKQRVPLHGKKNVLGGTKGLKTGVKHKGRVLEKSAPGGGGIHQTGGRARARAGNSKKFVDIKIPKRELIGFSDKELKEIKEELVLWHRRSFKNMKGGKR